MRHSFRGLPLWVRIYLLVFGLVCGFAFFFAWRVLDLSGEDAIRREYENAMDKHTMIRNSLGIYSNTVEDHMRDPAMAHELLARAVQNYGRYYTDQNSFIALTARSGKKLFGTIAPEDLSVLRLDPPLDGRRLSVIRRTGPRRLLFVSGWIEIGGELYRLDFARDITGAVASQKALARQISVWLSTGMIVLAIGLYALVRQALRPLAQLGVQARAMASGKYEHRISVQRGDEIGRLADDFNQMADAVQAHMELLQQALQRREAFMVSLAHELKTPITSVMGYAELLQSYQLDDRSREQALGFIRSEMKRLDELARKLLELFRLSNGGVLRAEKILIDSLFQQVESVSAFVLTRKGQTLQTSASVTDAHADPELLLVLLTNLIENASKASESGSVIRIWAYAKDDSVALAVQDDGCGIPDAHLHDVFEPFFMMDQARDRKKGGHGLGLSLCQAIAKAHGGCIRLESAPGAGTTVTVLLPDPKGFGT